MDSFNNTSTKIMYVGKTFESKQAIKDALRILSMIEIFGFRVKKSEPKYFIMVSIWFMVWTWLFAPFLFNPSAFEWQKLIDDWKDWSKWIFNQGGIGVPPEKSWESWWVKEHEHLQYSGKFGIILEILLSLRFFIYQYGLVYHLSITKHSKSLLVYGASWLLILFAILLTQILSVLGRRWFSASFQLVFRLIKAVMFLTFLAVVITLVAIPHLTLRDIFVCIIGSAPTGWGLLLICQALKGWLIKYHSFWRLVKRIARHYDYMIGLFLFTPIALLAWFPFVSEFQTRMLFNQAFSRGLQISRILGGQRKDNGSSKSM